MSKREETLKVNAGSMADIAFLLLIFFLVTTSIETDAGLDRMLPRENDVSSPISKRNILSILINGEDDLMVNGEIVEIKDLKELAIAFLDNGGVKSECDYCQGENDPKSSDNPHKAIVSLLSNRETSYGVYVTVQNELVAAYHVLRNREAQRLYKTDFTAMESLYSNPETSHELKKELKLKIRLIQKLYPMKLSEAERS
ncbi:ExbD/TolR family protein [Maribacter sp. 2304DJ31-5]|uniref:ExbD/TolR family protein n=1 Tax=Maribacter sp. 2304DJ31-5 TaxID=3386273 RepID=UPI0039BC81BD